MSSPVALDIIIRTILDQTGTKLTGEELDKLKARIGELTPVMEKNSEMSWRMQHRMQSSILSLAGLQSPVSAVGDKIEYLSYAMERNGLTIGSLITKMGGLLTVMGAAGVAWKIGKHYYDEMVEAQKEEEESLKSLNEQLNRFSAALVKRGETIAAEYKAMYDPTLPENYAAALAELSKKYDEIIAKQDKEIERLGQVAKLQAMIAGAKEEEELAGVAADLTLSPEERIKKEAEIKARYAKEKYDREQKALADQIPMLEAKVTAKKAEVNQLDLEASDAQANYINQMEQEEAQRKARIRANELQAKIPKLEKAITAKAEETRIEPESTSLSPRKEVERAEKAKKELAALQKQLADAKQELITQRELSSATTVNEESVAAAKGRAVAAAEAAAKARDELKALAEGTTEKIRSIQLEREAATAVYQSKTAAAQAATSAALTKAQTQSRIAQLDAEMKQGKEHGMLLSEYAKRVSEKLRLEAVGKDEGTVEGLANAAAKELNDMLAVAAARAGRKLEPTQRYSGAGLLKGQELDLAGHPAPFRVTATGAIATGSTAGLPSPALATTAAQIREAQRQAGEFERTLDMSITELIQAQRGLHEVVKSHSSEIKDLNARVSSLRN
jgi:myosin heavy subunit